MTHEQLWAVAQEPVPAAVVGAWGLLGAVIAVFILRFRREWREGVKAGAALVAASVALAFFIVRAREASTSHDKRVGHALWPSQLEEPLEGRCRGVCVVPADAGTLLHGLKVIAEGITGAKGLEADGSNAFVAAATISRVPLGGGAPQTMVSHAMPVATAADATSLYWTDASVSGQTTVLRVPLTATGWEAFAGDAGSAQVATTLATKPGAPGAFTLADGYLYFGAGDTVWRVPSGGGTAQQVVTEIAPTGIAVRGDTVYVGDNPNEAIQYVGLTGMFAGVLGGFHSSNATPTQLALSGDYLYWGDWYGSVEYVPVAAPTSSWKIGNTPCGGGACILRMLRPMNGGVVWVSGDSSCSHIGKVDSAGSAYFAIKLAVIGGLAVTDTHVYAVTGAGQLLQFDL